MEDYCNGKLMELRRYWKALILIIFISGFFLMLTPSPLSEPNFQGVPIIPITLFVFAVTLYSLVAEHRKTLFVTIVILLTLLAYTGFWAYNYKMPLSNLQMTMLPVQIRTNPTFHEFGGNQSDIKFNLTIRNPTDINTPPFTIENIAFYINNVKLKIDTYSMWGWHWSGSLGQQGYWYFDPHIIIKAHQTLIVNGVISISIYSNHTKTEEGIFENVWECVINKNFTLSLRGFFTSRPNFTPGDFSRQSMIVLASSSFAVSCRYA